MAKKRVATVESDSDESVVQSASATKRARKNTNGDSVSQNGSDDSRLSTPVPVPDGDDQSKGGLKEDEIFEKKFGQMIKAAIHSKNTDKTQGRIAKHGIIQHIEMIQFMCHPRLSFSFGPQINFIIGHNGSGKSAVLSAITVALGGKAASTGRGNGLKSFIREGQQMSEVSITLKNEGDEAYRHDVYGDSIIVTRRFKRDGTGSYKIKSKNGKVISTKKEELIAICDHMNIQVDNPMTILNQDASRQFLSAAHSTDKYLLFLKGTQLSQLSDEYQTCFENVGKASKIVNEKKKALPDLERLVADAASRYRNAQKTVEQHQKLVETKRELAWAHVRSKQNDWTSKLSELAKAESRIPKCEGNVDDANAKVDQTTEVVKQLEEELKELGNIDEIEAEKLRLNGEMKENRNLLHDFSSNEKKMVSELNTLNKIIENYQNSIAQEAAKLREDKQVQREERERKMQAAREEVMQLEGSIRDINENIRGAETDRNGVIDEWNKLDKQRTALVQKMQDCGDQHENVQRQMQNRLNAYGRKLPEVLARIRNERWHGDVPIGPIGDFVSLKDLQWQFLMRAQLGNLMTAFAVTNARDRPLLKRILNESNNNHVQIIVAQKDIFDYSQGEPPERYLTVLRALNITDEYVKRILINQLRVERVLLASTRREGQAALDSLGQPGIAWTSDRHRIQNYAGGGGATLSIAELNRRDPKTLLFVGVDLNAELERWTVAGRECHEQISAITTKMNDLEAERRGYDERLLELKRQGAQVDATLRTARRVRDVLTNEHNEDLPVSIQALEEAKAEQESAKLSLIRQFEDLARRKEEVHKKQRPLLEKLKEIKAKIGEHIERKDAISDQITNAIEERLKARTALAHYQKKLKDENVSVGRIRKAAEVLETEYESWTHEALIYCDNERIETSKTPEELQQKINGMENALKEAEEANGASIRQLEENLLKSQETYSNAAKDLEDLEKLVGVLKLSMAKRIERWHRFRSHIALRTKFQFQYHLSKRDYWGTIVFDHERLTLDLKIEPLAQAGTQGSREKNTLSLSGGEKSFSTICLLLALWEAIGSPIRCLDEFDVFMDAVNRRVSMKMMIDTANSSDGKQYILITPQDPSTIQHSPSVRVHRMSDPERGQNTLSFS